MDGAQYNNNNNKLNKRPKGDGRRRRRRCWRARDEYNNNHNDKVMKDFPSSLSLSLFFALFRFVDLLLMMMRCARCEKKFCFLTARRAKWNELSTGTFKGGGEYGLISLLLLLLLQTLYPTGEEELFENLAITTTKVVLDYLYTCIQAPLEQRTTERKSGRINDLSKSRLRNDHIRTRPPAAPMCSTRESRSRSRTSRSMFLAII